MKTLFAAVLPVLFFSTLSHASAYHCEGLGHAKGEKVSLEILSDKQVKVNADLADLDEAFSPRLNKSFVRFEYQQSEEGITEILIQQQLLDGDSKGLVKIQNRSDDFLSITYSCQL